ncbi:hypothetical protein SISNIDRAFT_490928 [Sistotremastrum niveocremeum HHB9708]|uniref:DUF6532 domain-containing protein n=1 Tax=Sistotremastrum niveocremeum HHB9708 TaxID=1314777 RepID=A0A164NCF5_9AGAM|nr:hypothetical protein SISNIDRAFT_490928 [Sistotremastrum niveocremeum HHB9708]
MPKRKRGYKSKSNDGALANGAPETGDAGHLPATADAPVIDLDDFDKKKGPAPKRQKKILDKENQPPVAVRSSERLQKGLQTKKGQELGMLLTVIAKTQLAKEKVPRAGKAGKKADKQMMPDKGGTADGRDGGGDMDIDSEDVGGQRGGGRPSGSSSHTDGRVVGQEKDIFSEDEPEIATQTPRKSSFELIPHTSASAKKSSPAIFTPIASRNSSSQPPRSRQSVGSSASRTKEIDGSLIGKINDVGDRRARSTATKSLRAEGEISMDTIHSSTPPPIDRIEGMDEDNEDHDEEIQEIRKPSAASKGKAKATTAPRLSLSPPRSSVPKRSSGVAAPAAVRVPSPSISRGKDIRSQSSTSVHRKQVPKTSQSKPLTTSKPPSSHSNTAQHLEVEDDDEGDVEDAEGDYGVEEDKDMWPSEKRPRIKVRRVRGKEWPEGVDPFYGPIDGKLIPRRHPEYTKGKVHVSQYHPRCKRYLERAYIYICWLLATKSAFPNPSKCIDFAVWAWQKTMESYSCDYGYDEFILDHNPRDPKCQLRYFHPAIRAVLQESIFKKHKVGHYFFREFNKEFRLGLIALACTAIHNMIDEFNDGESITRDFTHADYSEIYEAHLSTLLAIPEDGEYGALAFDKLANYTNRDLNANLTIPDETWGEIAPYLNEEELRQTAKAMAEAVDSDASDVGGGGVGGDGDDGDDESD